MKNKLNNTLKDLNSAKHKNKINFLITRFNRDNKIVSDLDVLVKPKDFEKFVNIFVDLGYTTEGHDHALGGRIPGAQLNLKKINRIKIDLHKDFTWRKRRYLDLEILWEKKKLADEFLVFINIIFEKTYLEKIDYDYVWQKRRAIFENQDFLNQSKKYNWDGTFKMFINWKPKKIKFPLFLPLTFVLWSYLEKFNLKSFLYYLFFRTRYLITKQLPYD